MQESIQMTNAMEEDTVEVCRNCRNVYKVIWLKEGDDWNDFGYRHCPYCGLVTNEYAHLSNK